MIVINGTIRIPPHNLARALPIIETLVETTRREDGCLSYAFAQDLFHPGLIRIAETWRDQRALDAHQQAPHFTAWRAANPDLGVSDRDLVVYEVRASRPL